MNKYLSSKIKIVSFITIIAVVFAHAYNWADNYLQPMTTITEGLNYSADIEYFISNGLVRFSVPVFFLISGYLFFYTFKLSLTGYIYKLKSRFKSLVIPYFAWSILSIIFCNLLINLPIKIIMDWKYEKETGNILNFLISPPPFQFWFIVDLFKFVIIAPLIYLVIKKFKLYVAIPIFLIWVINFKVPGISNNTIEGLLFFYLGSYLSIWKREDIVSRKFNKKTIAIVSSIWIILLIFKTVYAGIMGMNQQLISIENTLILIIVYKLSVLIGIFSVWYGFDIIFNNESRFSKILNLSEHTFFIYAFHVPILNIIFQYILFNTGYNNEFNLLVYFGSVILVILTAIALSLMLLRYFPVFHMILSGGRGARIFSKNHSNNSENKLITRG